MKKKFVAVFIMLLVVNCTTKESIEKPVEEKEVIEEETSDNEDNTPEEQEEIKTLAFTNPFIENSELVHHTYYDLQYSETDEQAYWVSYKLTPDFLNGTTERSNNFKSDPLVSTGSARYEDYTYSGYDRGHLAPAGSMNKNSTAMNESFYMSNMSPQSPSFNRGIWKRLENQVRTWTYASDSLFVVSGPILKNIEKTIGSNNVSVPKQFYKVLLRFKNKEVSSIGFLLNNISDAAEIKTKVVTIDSIEKVSGVDFNYLLEDSLEVELESRIDISSWDFN